MPPPPVSVTDTPSGTATDQPATPPSDTTVYIKSFGCQMNVYDAQRMTDTLEQSGMRSTDCADKAKVIFLNTCSVREKAQDKLFDELGRLRRLKIRDPAIRIGVGGCVASQEGARILDAAPFVDLVFGPQTIHRLPDMLAARATTGKPQIDISFPAMEKFDCLPTPGKRGAQAFVSVMEGCSKYCSFCVVPYTRGREVSRPVTAVLDEVANLALSGVREVTLLGQNVNAYLGAQPAGATANFTRLLECVSYIDGIERIRYTTSHPINFTDDLAVAHATLPKLMPHVHLPVQAGDDRILAQMKRGHTLLEYKAIIRKLRAARPGISISTDFIVGFPGETDRQFASTLALARDVRFDGGYVFIYSMRPGTPAAYLPDPNDRKIKVHRLETLNAVLQQEARQRSTSYVNTIGTVLVEGPDKTGKLMCGRLPDNRIINIAGVAQTGELREVYITSVNGYVLKGKFLPTRG